MALELSKISLHEVNGALDAVGHVHHGQDRVLAHKTGVSLAGYCLVKNGNRIVGRTTSRQRLTADDTGAYGQDLGTDIATLVEELLKIEGDYTLNIYHLEANWLIKYLDRLTACFQSGKIDAIFSPIQSGSNRILKAMRRPYTVEEYVGCIKALRKEVPSLKIWNQFIVGFPGETEEDFENLKNDLTDSLQDHIDLERV